MPNFIITAVYVDGLAPLGATLSASTLMSNFVSLISIKGAWTAKTIAAVIAAATLVNTDYCIAIIDLNVDPKAGMMSYLVRTII